jgi:hypothetical protein
MCQTGLMPYQQWDLELCGETLWQHSHVTHKCFPIELGVCSYSYWLIICEGERNSWETIMKALSIFFTVGMAFVSVTSAYAGSENGLQSKSTSPVAHSTITPVHLKTSANSESAKAPTCKYKDVYQCLAACGGGLCSWCPGNGKYSCSKE